MGGTDPVILRKQKGVLPEISAAEIGRTPKLIATNL
jgi:hypothetical protein